MASVNIFKVQRERGRWLEIINMLPMKVYDRELPTEVAIILSGKFENSTVFEGKKILIYKEVEWHIGECFSEIMEYYYDEIVDVSNMPPEKIARKITEVYNAERRNADN